MSTVRLSLVTTIAALVAAFGLSLCAAGGVSASIYCEVLWGPEGVELSQLEGERLVEAGHQQIVSDGAGGAFIGWSGTKDDDRYHLFIQHIDAAGTALWESNGKDVSQAAISEYWIAEDGFGGVIACFRQNEYSSEHYYVQRLDADGTERWAAGGVLFAYYDFYPPDLSYCCKSAPDGSGGAMIIYDDGATCFEWDPIGMEWREFYYSEIWLQHVDENGLCPWGNSGKKISSAPCDSYHGDYAIAPDGSGGVFTAYLIPPSGSYWLHYIRVDRWDHDGTLLGSEDIMQDPLARAYDLRMSGDGLGGVIVSWRSRLDDVYTLRAQRVSPDGTALWAVGGEEIAAETVESGSSRIASDGEGGAIVTWVDNRSAGGSGLDIYAQRLDAAGVARWASGGIVVCGASEDQTEPQITGSGAKGAIISWKDARGLAADIYAQRLDSLGVSLWAAGGLPACSEIHEQTHPLIASDESGGAVVTWEDFRLMETGDYEIYAQRLDEAGADQWTAGGEVVCEFLDRRQVNVVCVSDGAGGSISAWNELMGGIYLQRVESGGTAQWGNEGMTICPPDWMSEYPQIVTNGSGGAIVAWQDSRSGGEDIYAQQVDAGGAELWSTEDIAICTASGEQLYPKLAEDEAGGAIICWEDNRSGNLDVYAQRIGSGGSVLWAADGIGLCTYPGDQEQIQVIPDGSGGAIAVWADGRGADYDIYAQRVDASGTELWNAAGAPVCIETGDQEYPRLVSDGSGGAIVTWRDERGDPYSYYYYAQRIGSAGSAIWDAGGVAVGAQGGPVLYLYDPQPRIVVDGEGGAIITWPQWHDAYTDYYYHFVQRIGHDGSVMWTPGGLLLSEISDCVNAGMVSDGSGGAMIIWADQDEGLAAQYVDSEGGFLWDAGGESVAGAYPYSTIETAPDGAGGALIAWDDDESRTVYGQRIRCKPAVYAEVTIATEPAGLDIVVEGEIYGSPYILSAISGTEIEISVVSPQKDHGTDYYFIEWSDGGDSTHTVTLPDTNIVVTAYFTDVITDADVDPVPRVTALYQNNPNPFNPNTTIRFSLRDRGRVSLSIYDVAGRMVRVLVDDVVGAGPHEAAWDGRDKVGRAVSSGVYFYRMQAGEYAETRKMVLLR